MLRRMTCCLLLLFLMPPAVYGALPKEDDSTPDPRLDQKVTLELENVTLEDLCKELSRLTGVTFIAGRGRSDWQVKERRTVIFAKDVAVRDVVSRLSKLHHYRLSRSGSPEKWAYVLWQDRRSRNEEQALRNEEAAKLAERIASAGAYYSGLAGAASGMSEKELSELGKTDPFKHFLLTDPLGQAVCDLASKIPGEVWNGPQEWSLPVGGESPGIAQAGARLLSEWDAFQSLISSTFEPNEPENRVKPRRGPVTKIAYKPPEDRLTSQNGIFGELQIYAAKEGRESVESLPLIDPNGPFASAISKLVKLIRRGTTPQELGAAVQEINQGMRSGHGVPEEEDPLKDDPVLEEKVKIEEPVSYASALRAIYDKAGFFILSDSYREEASIIPKGETSIKALWTAIRALGKRSVKEDNWLVISDSRWYVKRLADIPEAYKAELRSALKERGLSLEDFERIALDLTDEQIRMNLLKDESFKDLRPYLSGNSLPALRFFGRITPQEAAAMTGDARFPVEMLEPEVLELGLRCIGMNLQDIAGKEAFLIDYQLQESKGMTSGASVKLEIPKDEGEPERKIISVGALIPPPPKKADAEGTPAGK